MHLWFTLKGNNVLQKQRKDEWIFLSKLVTLFQLKPNVLDLITVTDAGTD